MGRPSLKKLNNTCTIHAHTAHFQIKFNPTEISYYLTKLVSLPSTDSSYAEVDHKMTTFTPVSTLFILGSQEWKRYIINMR